MKNLQGRNRAESLRQIAGLSEVMVAFIKPLSPQDKQRAVSKVDDIKLFLSICNITSATIEKNRDNYFAADCAARILNKIEHSFPISIEAKELESLWKKITEGWWSKDFFIYLKMAIYTRLPGQITQDAELETAANAITEAKAKEFAHSLAAHDAEIESRINDPAYWEQIRRDLKNF